MCGLTRTGPRAPRPRIAVHGLPPLARRPLEARRRARPVPSPSLYAVGPSTRATGPTQPAGTARPTRLGGPWRPRGPTSGPGGPGRPCGRRTEAAAGGSGGMTRYLISFDDGAMDHIPDEFRPDVGRAAHAVVQQAMDAGVWEFGAGLQRQRARVLATDGTSPTAPTRTPIGPSAASGSSTSPHATRRWRGPPGSPSPAAATRRSASSWATPRLTRWSARLTGADRSLACGLADRQRAARRSAALPPSEQLLKPRAGRYRLSRTESETALS
jgi:hypothetical protein